MSEYTEAAMLQKIHYDLQRMAAATEESGKNRVTSLSDTGLAVGTIVEAVGVPIYINNDELSGYATYGLTEPGWYVFARIESRDGSKVTDGTSVEGAAGYIAVSGASYVDVAVRFEVAAVSKKVTISWGSYTEDFVFKATDLAVRNLDYRVTFYVYDAAEYAKWTYARATSAAFSGTTYYTEENGVYTKAAVKAYDPVPADTYYTHSYALTEDTDFAEGTVYYTKEGTVYTEAEVTPGEAVTANTYYVDKYTLTTDKEFVGTAYYVENEGEYEQAAVIGGDPINVYYIDQFDLAKDETFVGTTYYQYSGGEYVKTAVRAGEPIPENTYYVHSYALTPDVVFAEGTTYYTKTGNEYTIAEVTPGEAVTANTYYVDKYTLTTDTEFVGTKYYYQNSNLNTYSQEWVIAGEPIPENNSYYYVHSYVATADLVAVAGVAYYTKEGTVYTEAEVTVGTPLPTAYYTHSKITFEGMVRNVTYRFNALIDCPVEFVLPEIEDETHGAWFEIKLRHAGSYSSTLVPPSDDVKIATEHTQAETKGFNMVNLHYTVIDGVKVWRFMNTHSTIPTT